MSDTTEHAIYTRSRRPDFGLFAVPEEGEASLRHVAAIASVEASGLPGETALVARVTNALLILYRGSRFTADTVAALLTEEGVPRDGAVGQAVRRRLTSRIVNAGRGKLWQKVGKVMTKDGVRSGREIAVWEVL